MAGTRLKSLQRYVPVERCDAEQEAWIPVLEVWNKYGLCKTFNELCRIGNRSIAFHFANLLDHAVRRHTIEGGFRRTVTGNSGSSRTEAVANARKKRKEQTWTEGRTFSLDYIAPDSDEPMAVPVQPEALTDTIYRDETNRVYRKVSMDVGREIYREGGPNSRKEIAAAVNGTAMRDARHIDPLASIMLRESVDDALAVTARQDKTAQRFRKEVRKILSADPAVEPTFEEKKRIPGVFKKGDVVVCTYSKKNPALVGVEIIVVRQRTKPGRRKPLVLCFSSLTNGNIRVSPRHLRLVK
jgi:hypothetical protein